MSHSAGFTLLELMTATIIMALLVTIAVPTYRARLERMKVTTAESDLRSIALAIDRYRLAHNDSLPAALTQLAGVPGTDPWGHAYAYLNFAAPIPGIKGKIRKDHNLHPLNSEFDLYSAGADGASVPPLTAKAAALLCELGCQFLQGFLFARPATAMQVEEEAAARLAAARRLA
jgi:general secretion pathway protein G